MSRSAWRTHRRSVSFVQPIFSATDRTAPHCDICSVVCSCTNRTARSRTSGENRVNFPMTPSSHSLESPAIPARFTTHAFLADNPDAAFAAVRQFRRVLAAAKRHNDQPFAVARSVPSPDDHDSFDARLLAEIRETGTNELLKRSEADQAAMMVHLALDASTYGALPSPGPSYPPVEVGGGHVAEPPVGNAPPVGGSKALADSDRVWIYAPGRGASNWSVDYRNSAASIGWARVGDISNYSSEDELRIAIEDDEGDDSDAASSAASAGSSPTKFVPAMQSWLAADAVQ